MGTSTLKTRERERRGRHNRTLSSASRMASQVAGGKAKMEATAPVRRGQAVRGFRASITNPLASTAALGCRASSRSTNLIGERSHIRGINAR